MNLVHIYNEVEKELRKINSNAVVDFTDNGKGVIVDFTHTQTVNEEHLKLSKKLRFKNTIKIKNGRGSRKGLKYASLLVKCQITRIVGHNIIEIEII